AGLTTRRTYLSSWPAMPRKRCWKWSTGLRPKLNEADWSFYSNRRERHCLGGCGGTNTLDSKMESPNPEFVDAPAMPPMISSLLGTLIQLIRARIYSRSPVNCWYGPVNSLSACNVRARRISSRQLPRQLIYPIGPGWVHTSFAVACDRMSKLFGSS